MAGYSYFYQASLFKSSGPKFWCILCNISGRTKGIVIFRAPTGNDEWSNNGCKNITNVVTRDHIVEKILRERIGKKYIYVCEKHFLEKQLLSTLPILKFYLKRFEFCD